MGTIVLRSQIVQTKQTSVHLLSCLARHRVIL